MISYKDGMNLGRIRDWEKSSWAEAMDAHPRLKASIPGSGYLYSAPRLSPLGEAALIKDEIAGALEYIRGYRGDELPRIFFTAIHGTRGELALPSRGIQQTTLEDLSRAADSGLDELTDAVDRASGSAEREGSEPISATAWAVTLSSIADTAFSEADLADPDSFVKYDRTFSTIAMVCDAVATASVGVPVVSAVLEVVAIICRIAVAIGNLFKDFFRQSDEGRRGDWSWPDSRKVLWDKLRILVQCEGDFLNETGYYALLKRNGLSESEDLDAVHDFIDSMLTAVRTANGRDAREDALSICRAFGSQAASYTKCVQIREWLMFLGPSQNQTWRDRVTLIFDWLYEARLVTVVQARQRAHKKGNTHYSGDRDDFYKRIQGSAAQQREEECLHGSMWDGSPEWYAQCQGLAPEQFVPFSYDDLQGIHEWLRQEIGAVATTDGSFSMVNSPALAIFRHLVSGTQGTVLRRALIQREHPESEYMVSRDFRNRVIEIRTPQIYALAAHSLGSNDVHAVVRPSYTFCRVGDEFWGAIVAFREASSSANLGGVMPAGFHWAITEEEIQILQSSAFKQRLAQEIAAQRPSGGPSTGLLVAGAGAAAALGYFLLKR